MVPKPNLAGSNAFTWSFARPNCIRTISARTDMHTLGITYVRVRFVALEPICLA